MIKILRALKATVKLKETRRRKLSHRVHSSSTRAMYVLITPTNLAWNWKSLSSQMENLWLMRKLHTTKTRRFPWRFYLGKSSRLSGSTYWTRQFDIYWVRQLPNIYWTRQWDIYSTRQLPNIYSTRQNKFYIVPGYLLS